MRQCKTCCEVKEISEFPKNGVDKEGNVRHRVNCKTCYNIQRKFTKQKTVTKFLNNTKHRTGEVGTYGLADWRDAMLHFKGACAYCGTVPTRHKKLTKDHVLAVNNGGKTTRDNIVPSCRSCNSSKGDTDVFEWMGNNPRKELVESWISQSISLV